MTNDVPDLEMIGDEQQENWLRTVSYYFYSVRVKVVTLVSGLLPLSTLRCRSLVTLLTTSPFSELNSFSQSPFLPSVATP